MAYTIQSTPAALSSVHNDLIYTVAYPEHTADQVLYPNFKFVGDVYVGSTLVTRLKKVPDPTTNIGIFNISQIVRNYLTLGFNPSSSALIAQELGNGEFNLKVTMKFGEEYSYTTYTNLVTDSERTFYNNYVARDEEGLTNDEVLSDRPTESKVRCDSAMHLFPFFRTSSGTVTTEIKTYNHANTLVTVLNPTPVVSVPGNLINLNVSKDGINSIAAGTITEYIKYYTVQMAGGTIYRFTLDCECIHERFTLHFLNKYGGFESKDFTKVSRKTISIERKDFGKLPYTVDSSGVVSYKNSNNVFNESRSVYASQFKEKMTLNSDLLTDAEYIWLEQLVLSPMVYLEENGSYYPVVIVDNDYERKKVINDELTNLTLRIEFGSRMNAQFR